MFSGTGDKRPNVTKAAAIVPIALEIPRVLDAVSQEPQMKTKYIREIEFGHLNDQIYYIFRVSHSGVLG